MNNNNNNDEYDNTELDESQVQDLEEERLSILEENNIDEMSVLTEANKHIGLWEQYFTENKTLGKSDMEFALRDQWTAIERGEFQRLFKPAMQFNKLYDPIKKIIGEQRRNTPDLKVRSLTGKATQDEINLRADIVRSVAYHSSNDIVYQTAFGNALLYGFGAFEICTEYETSHSFNQVIRYKPILNPAQCFFDPHAQMPHKGDGNYCGKYTVMSKDEFYATYPHIKHAVSYVSPQQLVDFQWETRDTITICDYYVKEWYSKIIYMLDNGDVVDQEEWDEIQKLYKDASKENEAIRQELEGRMPEIINERKTEDYRIKHYRLIKDKIIEFAEWPSKYLPIIFVDGDSYYIDGQQYTRSFIRNAKDAQRFLNYLGSEIAGQIKSNRREQWVVTPDNIKGFEQIWRNPELQMGALQANPDKATGQLPIKVPPSEIPQSLLAHYQRATQDIKEIIGFFEANEGSESNEVSGIAVQTRAIQGSMAASVYFDNLNRAIEQGGRVVLDLLPTIYDTERNIVVTKRDGETKSLTINKNLPDNSTQNALTRGDFDIEIDTGPSFAVQKAQALQMFIQLVQANPQVFPLVADLIAKNLDMQYMPQVVDRLKTLVPEQILAKEEGRPPSPPKPNPQQQMMAMQQQLAQQQLMERAQELKIRQEKHELEKAKLALDAQKMMADMKIDGVKAQTENHKAELNFTADMVKFLSELGSNLHKDSHF
jgi:hypothetical protein